jgi:chitinase
LPAGQNLKSAVIGDVDGDGNLDLVAGGNVSRPYYWYYDYDPANIKQASVLLGDGQGGFSLPIASSLGTIPDIYSSLNKLVLADLTGDGLLDLVAVDSSSSEGAIVAANDGNWGAPVELSITDVSVVEGDSGSASAVFIVTLSGDTGGPVTVDFVAFDYYDQGDLSSARAEEDYTSQSGTLTFAPGVLSQTIAVPVFGDRLGEGNETFLVNLSNPSGALLRDAEAVGTIVDNEPDISIDHAYGIDPLTVVEGDSGTTPAVFTVTLSQPYGQDVTVDYFTSTGHTSDIVSASGTLRFVAGQTTKTITVHVVGDLLDEDLEAFNVYLSNPSPNASIAANAGYCYIEDNDPTPTVSIGDVSKNEGNSGATKFTFTLTLSSPTADGGYVEFATSNGTATTANQDYVAKSGYVYFASGETIATISIDVKGDNATEANETFFVNLIGAGDATIGDGQGIGTILNDDDGSTTQPPTVSISDASVVEGNSGSRTMTFTVNLSTASSQTVRVGYKTANGTATTGNKDYVAKSGTVSFAPGQTSKTVAITITGDRKVEQDEQFYVKLSGAKNAAIGDGTGVGTILNDDGSTANSSQKSQAAAVDAALNDWMAGHKKKRKR